MRHPRADSVSGTLPDVQSLQVVLDAAHAAHACDRLHQPRQLRLKNGSTQPNAAVRRGDIDGVRVRDDTSHPRPDPLDENTVVHDAAMQCAASAGADTCDAMCEVVAERVERISAGVRRVRHLVADERAPPTAALGVKELHEPGANAQARQHRPSKSEHRYASRISNTGIRTQRKCH
jgi:hypothetical protein